MVVDEKLKPSQLTHNVVEKHVPRSLICTGDLHYDITDPVIEACRVAFMRDVKPEMAVDVGDFWDCWWLSTYPKSPRRLRDPSAQLQRELDASQPYIKETCRIVDRFHMIPGNHEFRLEKTLGREPGLHGLRVLEWPTMAELPSKVHYHQYGARLRVGPMTFEHGHQIPKSVKAPASWMLKSQGNRNTIFGHGHSMEHAARTVYDEFGNAHHYGAWAQGAGLDFAKQDYAHEPSWQHGFTYLEFFKSSAGWQVSVHPIQIVNGRFSYGGKVYDGKKWM